MARVIGISGKKLSGKTSLAYYMKAKFLQERFDRYKGFSIVQDKEGEVFFGEDIGLGQTDLHPVAEIENSPIEVYSFGDALKECCMYALGLAYEQCYGTDEQKNTWTKYKWDNLPLSVRQKYSNETEEIGEHTTDDSGQFGFTSYATSKVPRTGYLTAREVMQVFGTDICRDMFHDNIWVDATFSRIKRDDVEVAIIADVRFPSEVEAIVDQPDHNLVRLSRNNNSTDTHASETSLDSFEWGELGDNVLLVDNKNLEMQTKNNLVYDWLFGTKEAVNG